MVKRAIQLTDIDFKVIEGIRTIQRQHQLMAAGATRTLKSRHLTGHAVDIVPLLDLDRDGKIETEEMFAWPLYNRLAPFIKRAAAGLGIPIEWGGDWRTFKDGPHWQLPVKRYP